MSNNSGVTVGATGVCHVPEGAFSRRSRAVDVAGEFVLSEMEGELVFRPRCLVLGENGERDFDRSDPVGVALDGEGFDPESLYYDGLLGAGELERLGIKFSPAQ